jgi:hypothetical protein
MAREGFGDDANAIGESSYLIEINWVLGLSVLV